MAAQQRNLTMPRTTAAASIRLLQKWMLLLLLSMKGEMEKFFVKFYFSFQFTQQIKKNIFKIVK